MSTDADLATFLERERAVAYYNRYEKGFDAMSDNAFSIKGVWRTRKLAPTNTRGARIQVTSPTHERRVMPYDHGARDAHETAVREALAVMRPYWTISRVERVDIAATGYAFIVEGELQ